MDGTEWSQSRKQKVESGNEEEEEEEERLKQKVES
jgi:hypothetical protein